jgi:AcrR family transcriptional regulator
MQQRGESTRNSILNASVKLFSERGFNAASVDDICAEAGVSKGAFYHHFKSKHDLFMALLDSWLRNIDKAIEGAGDVSVLDALERVTEVFPYIFHSASGYLPMFLDFWLQASRDEELWQAAVAPYRRYHKYFTSLIQRGVDEGTFIEIDAELASRMIISTAMGLLMQSLMDPRGARWEEVARSITEVILRSLVRPEVYRQKK